MPTTKPKRARDPNRPFDEFEAIGRIAKLRAERPAKREERKANLLADVEKKLAEFDQETITKELAIRERCTNVDALERLLEAAQPKAAE